MKTNHVTNTGSVQTDSLPGVNSLSTDNLRATLTRNRQTIAGSNSPLFKLLLPVILVFVLATCSTTTLKADGRDEEGYIHKPKLVLWEEYYREWLDMI